RQFDYRVLIELFLGKRFDCGNRRQVRVDGLCDRYVLLHVLEFHEEQAFHHFETQPVLAYPRDDSACRQVIGLAGFDHKLSRIPEGKRLGLLDVAVGCKCQELEDLVTTWWNRACEQVAGYLAVYHIGLARWAKSIHPYAHPVYGAILHGAQVVVVAAVARQAFYARHGGENDAGVLEGRIVKRSRTQPQRSCAPGEHGNGIKYGQQAEKTKAVHLSPKIQSAEAVLSRLFRF